MIDGAGKGGVWRGSKAKEAAAEAANETRNKSTPKNSKTRTMPTSTSAQSQTRRHTHTHTNKLKHTHTDAHTDRERHVNMYFLQAEIVAWISLTVFCYLAFVNFSFCFFASSFLGAQGGEGGVDRRG